MPEQLVSFLKSSKSSFNNIVKMINLSIEACNPKNNRPEIRSKKISYFLIIPSKKFNN